MDIGHRMSNAGRSVNCEIKLIHRVKFDLNYARDFIRGYCNIHLLHAFTNNLDYRQSEKRRYPCRQCRRSRALSLKSATSFVKKNKQIAKKVKVIV